MGKDIKTCWLACLICFAHFSNCQIVFADTHAAEESRLLRISGPISRAGLRPPKATMQPTVFSTMRIFKTTNSATLPVVQANAKLAPALAISAKPVIPKDSALLQA